MIVITGATGNIGSKTAAALLAKGKKVTAITRQPGKLGRLRDQGAIVAGGDMSDADFLTEAFRGAEAVLLMIPPDLKTTDIAKFQQAAGEAQTAAVINAGVKNIVFISSLGIEASGNGSLVGGLAVQEKRLNALAADVNVICLRPTGFMENLFTQMGTIKSLNSIFSPLRADLRTGIIATQDIASVAARRLERLDFQGKTIQNLLGNRDYTQKEMAPIVGKAIGRPGLAYARISFEDYKKAILQYGISENVADAMIAMLKNIDAGYSTIKRSPENTTPTTLEYFAEHDFAAVFG